MGEIKSSTGITLCFGSNNLDKAGGMEREKKNIHKKCDPFLKGFWETFGIQREKPLVWISQNDSEKPKEVSRRPRCRCLGACCVGREIILDYLGIISYHLQRN